MTGRLWSLGSSWWQGRLPLWPILVGCAALAAVSLLAPSAPSYDPWSWLIWGREIADGQLATREGPAWKPLPVAITTLLAVGGEWAPDLWLLIARTATLMSAVLAWRLAGRLGGGALGGACAAAGVLLTAGWLRVGAQGGSEGILVALALLAGERHIAGRYRQALVLGLLCALVRVETWPFLAGYGVWLWRRDPAARSWLALAAVALPAAWFLPELAGSGDLLRSSERARIVEPGQPALASRPFLASLGAAAGLPLAPLAAGWAVSLVGWRRRALSHRVVVPFAGGVAWCVLVAAMAELGYSGEARYTLPGVAVATVSAGAGLGWTARTFLAACGGRRTACIAACVGVAAACAPLLATRAGRLAEDARALGDAAALSEDLKLAIAAAGGREAVLRCGPQYVGARRGPLLAWRLHVPKERVDFVPSTGRGVVFVSALREGAAPEPATAAGFTHRAGVGRWTVLERCGERTA